MSIKRILAAASASVVAVSAMAVVASAADFTGTIDIPKGDGWSDIAIVSKNTEINKLIGDADPATVDKITFVTDGVDFTVGYDAVSGWTQAEDFTQETVLNGSDIAWDKEGLCIKVCHNGAADPVTISWTVTFKEADAAPETPADKTEDKPEEKPADNNNGASNVDTGVEGVAVVVGVAAVAAGALIVAKKRK